LSFSQEKICKAILGQIYVSSLQEKSSHRALVLSEHLNYTPTEDLNFQNALRELEHKSLVLCDGSEIQISPEGRKKITVVMVGGTFDIIHPGHIDTLSQAKSLGDVLVVSVARNVTVQKTKGRPPMNDEILRQKLVATLRIVDAAILGSERDIFETAALVEPDIIALGYDQYHTEQSIVEGCTERGLKTRVVRLASDNPDIKTTSILKNHRELTEF
jgi:FAD synthetase